MIDTSLLRSYLLEENPSMNTARWFSEVGGVRGIMIHSTGVTQEDAIKVVDNVNKYTPISYHAIVDARGVFQTLPFNITANHCGGSGNSTHLSIEMCESGKPSLLTIVKNRTVRLVADLCLKYNLNPLKDVISHKEGHSKGIASNHEDPDNVWSKIDFDMNKFRKEVNSMLSLLKTRAKLPILCEVISETLNVRSGPGTEYDIKDKYDKNVKLVVREVYLDKNGDLWACLHDGAYYMSLDRKYVKW